MSTLPPRRTSTRDGRGREHVTPDPDSLEQLEQDMRAMAGEPTDRVGRHQDVLVWLADRLARLQGVRGVG